MCRGDDERDAITLYMGEEDDEIRYGKGRREGKTKRERDTVT